MGHIKVQKGVDKVKMKSKFLTAVAALVFALLSTSVARADLLSIGLATGTATPITTQVFQSPTAVSILSVPFGVFSVSATATGTPPLPQPDLDSNTINVSSAGAGTLWVYVTEQNITSPVGLNNFLSTFTSNALNGLFTSVKESTYVDSGNGLYALTTPLGSATFTGLATASSINPTGLLANPYSATEVFKIVAGGAGDSNDTIDLANTVPEPTTLSILGIGLLGLLGLRKKENA